MSGKDDEEGEDVVDGEYGQDGQDDEDGDEDNKEVEKMIMTKVADLSHRVKGEANKQAVGIPTCPLSEYEEKFILKY